MLSVSSVTKSATSKPYNSMSNDRVEEFNLLQYRVNSVLLANVKSCNKCNVVVRGDTCPVCGLDIVHVRSSVSGWKLMLDKIRTALFIDNINDGAYAMAA